ncbi:MAG: carbohydrate ABC transporter permease [Armatimonadota bacterium]
MPIVAEVGRKHWTMRTLFLVMYLVLAVLGVAMVYPFLITVTAAGSNAMDYNRFAPYSRALISREERFTRGIVQFFPEQLKDNMTQFSHLFSGVPATWTAWKSVGDDPPAIEKFARQYLNQANDPARWAQVKRLAADYDEFAQSYPLVDSVCALDEPQMAAFFRNHYTKLARQEPTNQSLSRWNLEARGLAMMSEHWGVPYDSFYQIRAVAELGIPFDQPGYRPDLSDPHYQDFLLVRQAYRDRYYLPGAIKAKWRSLLRSVEVRKTLDLSGQGALSLAEMNQALGTQYRSLKQVPFPVSEKDSAQLRKLWLRFTGEVFPVSETRPYPVKTVWLSYLGNGDVRKGLGLPEGNSISVEEYNTLFGGTFASLREIPFPIPANAPAKLGKVWYEFIQKKYPRRLIEVTGTPEIHARYRLFLRTRFRGNIDRCNEILKTSFTSWETVEFPPTIPAENIKLADLWIEFVGALPAATKRPHSAEDDYQRFLLAKYGSLEAVNNAYGWKYGQIEQVQMPFDLAYLVAFTTNERELFINSLFRNYSVVVDYLLLRGRALFNTLVLIVLTLLAALTVNPLAAYALSRFQMKQTASIVLFMLATMAFPAAVSMIPGYLLMRDLHLLNTFAALILPGVANGMGIFLLKGFFDSLPPELYEAAALDGAKEWQVFLRITIPLSMPILAVLALNSFMAAYSGWEWALITCQKQEMWTISVWLYQFSQVWSTQPWAVMAAFVVASIPVFLVFLLCQNIILRGIILPQMK